MAADRTHYADDATLARLAQLERLEAKVKEHNATMLNRCCLNPRIEPLYECRHDCPRQYIIEVPA